MIPHFLKTMLIESYLIYSINIDVYDIENMIVWQMCFVFVDLQYFWCLLKSVLFGKDMVGFARLNRGGERPRVDEPCDIWGDDVVP